MLTCAFKRTVAPGLATGYLPLRPPPHNHHNTKSQKRNNKFQVFFLFSTTKVRLLIRFEKRLCKTGRGYTSYLFRFFRTAAELHNVVFHSWQR